MISWLYQKMAGAQDQSQDDDTPRNFIVYVASHTLSKLGDALMNPKTTLSWLGGALGAPVWSTALLVPLRESGSMLLQILIAGTLRRFDQRKWLWSLGSLAQGLCVLGMAAVAWTLQGLAAGIALLTLVAAFALGRSLCSVASKDVLGRTVPKKRRGRASGWAASAAGLITLGVGVGGLWLAPSDMQAGELGMLLLAAAIAWFCAALLFSQMREPQANNEEDARDTGGRLRLLLDDRLLQRFILARALVLCSALSAPYYVLLAQRHSNTDFNQLMLFIGVAGIAGLIGGPLWGRLADRSSKQALSLGASAAALLGIAVFALAEWRSEWLGLSGLLPFAYLLLSLAHEGVRIGRKTWIVNIAEGERRNDYVAVSNSAMGVALLVVGGASAWLAEYSLSLALLLLSISGLLGAALGLSLPEAETDER